MSEHRITAIVIGVVVCGAVVGSLQADQRSVGASAPATGSVAGRVVDDTTHRGVPRATVTIRVVGLGVVAATTADAVGRFVVTGVPAREVTVDVERLGYLMPGADAGTRVTVRPNRAVTGVVLTLRREVLGDCGEARGASSLDFSTEPFPALGLPKFLPLELME